MRNSVFTFVVLVVLSLFAGTAFAQTGTIKSVLAPKSVLKVSRIEAGQYKFVLDFNDKSEMDVFVIVDDILVGVFGNFSTDPEPSHKEANINIPWSGALTLECVYLTGDGGEFSINYNRIGEVSSNTKIDGNTIYGSLGSTESDYVVMNIPQGTYDVYISFDQGENDVDWTLYNGRNMIASENGTENPDIETNINIPTTGKYTFNVRNLRENSIKYKLELKKGIPSTGSFSNNQVIGLLQPQAEFEINIPLKAGTYSTSLSFDQGDNDVDWSIYNGTIEIAAEYGTDNPDTESGVVIPKDGTYRLVVRNLRDNVVNFKLLFDL